MRYLPLDRQIFIDNRERFRQLLPSGGLAVFNSNDIYPTSADGTMPFVQHKDIFHLSGVDQEESILVIFPDAYKEEHREVLFLKETNEHIAVWEGEKLTAEKALEVSGISSVFWLQDFERVFNEMMSQAEVVFLNTNEHLRNASPVQTREDRFIEWCKQKYPAHNYDRSAPIMHRIRAVKSDLEIAVMQQAADITTKGYRRVLKAIKPGITEYELEAEFMHEFLSNRSRGFAYTPIIASGYNACVLHYIENKDVCNDGDTILFDVGAEYANYACDVTRVYPVSGKFTDRQKQIYNAVLRVQKASLEMLVPGNNLNDYHVEVGKLMTSELLDLGLIDQTDVKNENPKWPAYKKYFMHGTSHYIGLDTHDVGLWTADMQVGNVFTCEPGIYIPEENLGVRIEDDVVITENGLLNLTAGIPKEVEEIEDFMNS
ncbi:aminopeptidase P family protein [Phaeocystidibacter luteus]|uniref:Xaa-Pro aminopeptidase n=1 Tax=Phaeocystidibacter luteus TaxID=911197 RepID=A0A6N6RFB8_9FLAO|nr:aminopeptidase P family protein [Phaeocystidibacter luteus]KAB2805390.1 aminopeptidase P family protein [Phaeocystidibacter luteus]